MIDYYLPGGHLIHDHYDYDPLNRLIDHMEEDTAPQFRQHYSYDRYGNRTIDQTTSWGNINTKDFTVNAANNRLGVPTGQSGTMHYDAAGNVDIDTYTGSAVTRLYDAENRMTKETQVNSYEAGTYSYDGDGRRMKRIVNGVETWQVYGLGGESIGPDNPGCPVSSRL